MKKEIKRVKRERVYQGTIVDVYKDYMEFSNGNHEVWDYIHHKGAAAVIPVMDDGRLLMVRQYRNALDRFTLELPAGGLDQADEPGRDCSARELEEETGRETADAPAPERGEKGGHSVSVSRSGRVYSEEELRRQIH